MPATSPAMTEHALPRERHRALSLQLMNGAVGAAQTSAQLAADGSDQANGDARLLFRQCGVVLLNQKKMRRAAISKLLIL